MNAYDLDMERLKRRRAVADAVLAQSMQPMGDTQVVSGVAVRRSPMEGFAKLAQAYLGNQEAKNVDAEQRALQDRNRAEIASAIEQYTQRLAPRPGSSEPAMDKRAAALDLMGRVGDPRDAAKLLVADALRPPVTKSVDLGDSIGIMDERGNIVAKIPKSASPDARLREQGASERHVTPSGSAVLGAEVSVRGQDLTDRRTREEGVANRGVTVRGQNMTDARTREALDQGKVTDAQRMASAYADRMQAAEDKLNALTTGPAAITGKPGVIESMAAGTPLAGKAAANVARSTERQQYYQAAEDWVRAKLRKESGAVIADEEMDREIRTYFPQLGDKPEVIAQKELARKLATEGMVNASGRAPSAYTGPERRGALAGFKVLGVER